MAETWWSICLFVISIYLTVLQAQNLDCDFETDFCDWTTPSSSDRNWTRSDRSSGSVGTGPNTGHTKPGRDNYIYLHAADFKDSNNFITQGKCVLLSQNFSTTSSGGCFRFWYHMEGSGIGNLSIDVIEWSVITNLWTKVGQEGANWTCAYESLDENKGVIRIQITAWTGPNVQGDIALDDLKLFSQRCQTLTDPCTISPTTPSVTTQTISTDSTTSISSPSSSATSSTLDPNVTVKAPLTSTQPPDDISMMILYIAIAPVVILIIGGIVAYICYRKRKQKDIEIMVERNNQRYNNDYTNREFRREEEPEEEKEEVYHDLDEAKMDNDYGYTLPQTPSPQTELPPTFPTGKSGMYLSMKNSMSQEDAVSESSYVEAIPSPEKGSAGTKGFAPAPSAGEKEQNSAIDDPTSYINSVVGSHGKNAIASVQGGGIAGGREFPMPDYDGDDDARPPQCGPTSGYIRPIYA